MSPGTKTKGKDFIQELSNESFKINGWMFGIRIIAVNSMPDRAAMEPDNHMT